MCFFIFHHKSDTKETFLNWIPTHVISFTFALHSTPVLQTQTKTFDWDMTPNRYLSPPHTWLFYLSLHLL